MAGRSDFDGINELSCRNRGEYRYHFLFSFFFLPSSKLPRNAEGRVCLLFLSRVFFFWPLKRLDSLFQWLDSMFWVQMWEKRPRAKVRGILG